MTFVGIAVVATGLAAVAFAALRRSPATALVGVLYLAVGAWTARAGLSFRYVAETAGRDMRT